MKKLIIYFFLLGIVLASCKKDDYYKDSGIHEEKFNGSMMDFLDSKAKHPIDLFDTLVQVVRYAGLEEVLKAENLTFFAPPDPCINNAIKALNVYLYSNGQEVIQSFKEVKPEVWKYFLTQYMIEGDYGLIDFPQVDTAALYAFSGQLYQSYNRQEPLNVGVFYHDLENEDGVNKKTVIPYKGRRQILISYIPDFPQPKTGWVNTFIASSNIKPNNGRVHVVNFSKHILGFRSNRFVAMAREKGIDYEKRNN